MLASSMSHLISCQRKSWNIMFPFSSFLPATSRKRFSSLALRIETASKAKTSRPLPYYSTLQKRWRGSSNSLASNMPILCPPFPLFSMPTFLLSSMCLYSARTKIFWNSTPPNQAAWRSSEAWPARKSHPSMSQSQSNLCFRRNS